MKRPWPGDVVWYRMWGVGLLTLPAFVLFVGWFSGVALALCAMGAYGGVLVPLVYEGEWTRDEDGESGWLPAGSPPGEPRQEPAAQGGLARTIRGLLFPIAVIALLAYLAIDTH